MRLRRMIIFDEQDGRTKLINIAHYISAEALQTVLDMAKSMASSRRWIIWKSIWTTSRG
ncbi:hypothetical protein [Paenibacillus pinisoli]|uniref:hypothetical protein n=1 Tax=Paenibacillus pinisoli TaxID=1276110 RepID=UPI001402BC76|nr:hypothetical protein [Paenibacillus pinisoli]